jgi:hypothetical protein
MVRLVAGNGTIGFSEDGGPATECARIAAVGGHARPSLYRQWFKT